MKTFIKALEGETNSFSFKTDEYVENLLNDREKAFGIAFIGALCATHLAYTYAVCEKGNHWDDRNKASSIWAAEHKDALLKFMEEFSGEPFPWKSSEYRSQQYFLRDVAIRRLDPDLKDGLEYWVSVHPTLQQSMMCVFAKLFAALNIAGFDDNAAFPFI